MKSTTETYRKLAYRVFLFHLGWIFMVLIGTIVEILYPPYVIIQIIIVIATFSFQVLLGQGSCPLTLFENFLYEKSDPSKFYLDRNGDGSFIRHYLKEFFKINAPKGTTGALLFIVLIITIIIFVKNYLL